MTRTRALTCLFSMSLAAPIVASSTGCSDDGGEDDVVADTSSGDGDPTTTGDGDGDPDPTTTGDGDPTTTGDGDPTTTGDGDGDPGDGDPTTGDGDGDPEPVDMSDYSAVIMPGGVDRIIITRVNTDEQYNSCTVMTLWSPMNSDSFDITIPDQWAIETVEAWQTGFCPMDMSNPDLMPDGGTGTVTFGGYDALGTYPCLLNFDFELDMNSDPPTTRTWSVQGVPVDGINCG